MVTECIAQRMQEVFQRAIRVIYSTRSVRHWQEFTPNQNPERLIMKALKLRAGPMLCIKMENIIVSQRREWQCVERCPYLAMVEKMFPH